MSTKDDFLKAQDFKQSDPLKALELFLRVAEKAQSENSIELAYESYKEAISLKDAYNRSNWAIKASAWRYIGRYIPIEEFEQSVLELLELELAVPIQNTTLATNIAAAINEFSARASESLNETKPPQSRYPIRRLAIWKKVLPLLSKNQGFNEVQSLCNLELAKCSEACQEHIQAEEFFTTASKTSLKANQTAAQLELANYYVRTDQIEKLGEFWQELKTTLSSEPKQLYSCALPLATQVFKKEGAMAADMCNTALAIYKNSPDIMQVSSERESLWNTLQRCHSKDELAKLLIEITGIHESTETISQTQRNSFIIKAMSGFPPESSNSARNQQQVGKSPYEFNLQLWDLVWTQIKTLRVKDNPQLALLADNYAAILMNARSEHDAEKILLDAEASTPNSCSKDKAHIQLSLARHYFYRKYFVKTREYFLLALDNCEQELDSDASFQITNLLDLFSKNHRHDLAMELLTCSLKRVDIQSLSRVDAALRTIYSDLVTKADFVKAEDLLKLRIEDSQRRDADARGLDWRIRLSNLYLALGRNAESENLFTAALASLALRHEVTDSIRKERAELLINLGRADEIKGLWPKARPDINASEIRVRFGLYARSELRFTHNTRIVSYPEKTEKTDESMLPISICSSSRINIGSNFSMDGEIYCTAAAKSESDIQSNFESSIHFSGSYRVLKLPDDFSPPTSLPEPTQQKQIVQRLRALKRQPGDHVVTEFGPNMLSNTAGRWRFFFSDGDEYDDIHLFTFPGIKKQGIDLQFYYSGSRRKITVQSLEALIYAPHATVEIQFNGSFTGIIVANKIIALGNNQFNIDRRLIGQQIYP